MRLLAADLGKECCESVSFDAAAKVAIALERYKESDCFKKGCRRWKAMESGYFQRLRACSNGFCR